VRAWRERRTTCDRSASLEGVNGDPTCLGVRSAVLRTALQGDRVPARTPHHPMSLRPAPAHRHLSTHDLRAQGGRSAPIRLARSPGFVRGTLLRARTSIRVPRTSYRSTSSGWGLGSAFSGWESCARTSVGTEVTCTDRRRCACARLMGIRRALGAFRDRGRNGECRGSTAAVRLGSA
jgi:hypothetical protein